MKTRKSDVYAKNVSEKFNRVREIRNEIDNLEEEKNELIEGILSLTSWYINGKK